MMAILTRLPSVGVINIIIKIIEDIVKLSCLSKKLISKHLD